MARQHTAPQEQRIECPPCGKHLYLTRHAAKQAQRVYHPEEGGRLGVYRCPNAHHQVQPAGPATATFTTGKGR